MNREELQRLHDNLEFRVKLRLKELGNSYEGYGRDLIILNMYKEELKVLS